MRSYTSTSIILHISLKGIVVLRAQLPMLKWPNLCAKLSFKDYSSAGYFLPLETEEVIVLLDSMSIVNELAIGNVLMRDFLAALAKILKHNLTSYESYHNLYILQEQSVKCELNEATRVNVVFHHFQMIFLDNIIVTPEIRYSWFSCQKFKVCHEYECDI
ncbi:hypothetical protein K7X08_035864 [Anisodus acutangulus]|uniref:Uncharacterized protein n=1 Tax=Anisodus acutangulus TaxID=402998 RepID=A0A9Q1QVD1_9SOLA|nr:hypothetical protein K7X08_035864 [Anisodus acutangulus]